MTLGKYFVIVKYRKEHRTLLLDTCDKWKCASALIVEGTLLIVVTHELWIDNRKRTW